MDMNNDSDRLAKRLSNAFRNAAVETGLAVGQSLMTVGAAVGTKSVVITGAAALLSVLFAAKAMGEFSKGLEQPLPDDAKQGKSEEQPKHPVPDNRQP